MTEIPILIRPAEVSDLHFILHSWLRVMRRETPSECPDELFFKVHQTLLKNLLTRASAICAVNPSDTDQLFGYMVYEGNILHFSFVKSPFRRLHVFQRLLKRAFADPQDVQYSQSTYATKALSQKFKMIYNPYLFMEAAR